MDLFDGNTNLNGELVEKIYYCLAHEDKQRAIDGVLDWYKETTGLGNLVLCQLQNYSTPRMIRFTNYGFKTDWVDEYLREDFQKLDPVLSAATRYQGFFTWEGAFTEQPPPKNFLVAAADHGMTDGVSCSYSRKPASGITTVCSLGVPASYVDDNRSTLLKTILPALHFAMEQLPLMDPKLSQKELAVLRWAKDGKTVWETSKIMAISEATVKFHLTNIYEKLDCANRAHAVARALQLGVLE